MQRLYILTAFLLILAACVAAASGASAQAILHDIGDPRTMTKPPNCGQSRFYVDDSTGKMYQANTGSPCLWSDSSLNALGFANIAAYGAVSGAADAGPALRAAFGAVKSTGGTIYIPDGNWNFASLDPSSSGKNVLDAANASGIHLECASGANLTVSSSITPDAFIVLGEFYGLEQQTGFPFTAIPAFGASSLTLTTPSDASNFSVGQAIYIMGGPGTEAQPDGEINWVTSSNSSTGVIGLLKPTGKTFTGTGSSPLHVVPAPSNAFAYNLSVTGCHITLATGDFVYLLESIHTLISDNAVTLPATGARGMMINSYYPLADLIVKNNTYVGAASTIIQLADGWRDIVVEGNDFTAQSTASILNPSQGVENLTIAHNHLYQVMPPGASSDFGTLVFSTAYNVNVNDNTLQLDNESSSPMYAIRLGLSNGSCVHCSITGNIIQVSGPSATESGGIFSGAVPASIVGNTIFTSGSGISPAAGSTVTGNTIYLTGAGYGITIANDSVISGNRVYGAGTTAGTGIGYPTATGPATVTGNMVSNVQTAFVSAASNSIRFANNVCDNVSTSTNCNVPLRLSVSITPAAATASSCVEQTFGTFTGLLTTQQVAVTPPAALGSHVWIGGARASAANTLALSFCADATAGTPPAGAYLVTAQ